ncbi:hypothetical protein Poly51_63780 [Rubripirellula tenax]|uniref:Uncharacterized protein n=1 Tax=Rubripirellula tenax TaxID=2528015 RepID=A0A5C6E2T4_9BACT|nr:hypothetical protein Poly51_63780 [Rubripirellula tenax]
MTTLLPWTKSSTKPPDYVTALHDPAFCSLHAFPLSLTLSAERRTRLMPYLLNATTVTDNT